MSIEVAKQLLVGSWTELKSEHTFIRKLPNFLFCGLRYFTPDDEIHRPCKENNLRKQNLWTCWPILVMSGSLGWLLYFWGVKEKRMFTCSSEYLIVRSVSFGVILRELSLSLCLWLIGQVMFRYMVEPRIGVVDHTFRSLTTLANTVWGVLITGMFCVQLLVSATELDTGLSDFIFLSFYFFQWLSVFFIVAPFLSYMVVIIDSKQIEALYYIILVGGIITAVGRVLNDVTCGQNDMEVLTDRVKLLRLSTPTVNLIATVCYSFIRFTHTHSLALVLSIFFGEGRWGAGIVEPDMFMIGELFWPFKKAHKLWIFTFALGCVLVGGTFFVDALSDSLVKHSWKYVLEDCRYAHLNVSPLWHVVLNIACLIMVIRVYSTNRKRRSVGSFHSEVILFAGLFGIFYHAYAAAVALQELAAEERAVGFWGQVFAWCVIGLDFVAYLAFVILSADTFSGRIMFTGLGKQSIFFFALSCWVFADWVTLEASSLLAEVWRHCKAIDSRSEAETNWMLCGQAALAETGLFLVMGWTVHMIEKLVEVLGLDDALPFGVEPSQNSQTGDSRPQGVRFPLDGASTCSRLTDWSRNFKKFSSPNMNVEPMRSSSIGRSFDNSRSLSIWTRRSVLEMFGSLGDSSVLSRPGIAEGLMQMCMRRELEPTSRMGEQDMRRFAVLCGFTGSREDWSKEFRALCQRNFWSSAGGPDLKQFRLFVVDGGGDSRYQLSPHLADMFLKAHGQAMSKKQGAPPHHWC